MAFETIVQPPSTLARTFVARVSELARIAHTSGRPLTIALPGGSVAREFLPALAESALEWPHIHCFWGDERAVAPDDPESNYALADELLLRRVPIPAANVHRMPADDADLDRAAVAYERQLRAVLPHSPTFDLILLGVGPDGHVCSLFPGHAALNEATRLVVPITDSPKPPPSRLTLTLPALAGAEIHIAAFGAEKAASIAQALHDQDSPLPVARAARGASRALFLLDAAAAGQP
jgi:6-phosphogluconolactonase